jgi:hypothetical protein
MSLRRKKMHKLLRSLKKAHPGLSFEPAASFYWSPKQRIVYYRDATEESPQAAWSLLHELGHALLDHQDFQTDFELLQIEVAAWEKANGLAETYGYQIDPDHIQDCLDTYRDWLYQRSSCPTCTSCSLQTAPRTYTCHNCNTVWRVSSSRLCRAYRRKQKEALAVA